MDLSTHPERIFAIVNQFNLAKEALNNPFIRKTSAKLNLQAGIQAKAATAFEPAETYLRQGLELLPDGSWQQDYEFSLEMHLEAAEVAYLNDDLSAMERLINIVLEQARDPSQSTRAYEIKINAYALKANFDKALNTTIQALQAIGVRLPRHPTPLHAANALAITQLALLGQSIDKIRSQPKMEEKRLVVMRILMSAVAAAYLSDSLLLLLLVTTGIRLSLRYGNCNESAFFYSAYGMILCGFLGRINKGHEFGKLASELSKEDETRPIKAKVNTMTSCFIDHWKAHFHEVKEEAIEGYNVGVQVGDFEYASHCATIHLLEILYTGVELKTVEKQIADYSEELRGYVYSEMNKYRFAQMQQYIDNFASKNDDPCRLSGDHLSETQALEQYRQLNDGSLISSFYLLKSVLCYYFCDYPQAIENLIQSRRKLNNLAGSLFVPIFHFYGSLARIAQYPKMSKKERLIARQQILISQRKLKKWSRYAPMNHLHRYHLVKAECARIDAKLISAENNYEQAIKLARENRHLTEEALACELAGGFYAERQQERIAAHYLNDACYAYDRWGATAKVNELQTRYEKLLNDDGSFVFKPQDSQTTETLDTTTSISTKLRELDLDTILESARMLSLENELTSLMSQLLSLVRRVSGAQRSLLFLKHDGRWTLEAQQNTTDNTEPETVILNPPKTLEEVDPDQWPSGMVRFVDHTQEQLVLDDATQEGVFIKDPYVKAIQPKSVLCTPLLNQGKLNGILYLENNLATRAFTSKQLELVQLLSTQAAVALENARLYDNLGRSEQQYRRLFEDSRDAIIIATMEGVIVETNQALLEIGGYEREDLLHQHVYDFYKDPQTADRFRQALQRDGSVKDFEVQLRHKNGQVRDCLMTASLYQTDQEPLIQSIIRDITEHKRYNQRLEQEVEQRTGELQQMTQEAQTARAVAEKAMQAEQKRIGWLENMARFLKHETKNALVGANMSIDLIQSKSHDASIEKYIDRAGRSVKQVDDILGNIASATSLEAAFSKEQESTKTEIDFSILIEEHIEGYSDIYEQHKISISIDIENKIIIEGNDVFLTQMLEKIMSNAADYSTPGKPIQIKLFAENDNAVLQIINEGQKLPADRESLLDLFVSKRTEKERQSSNIGLGLYIVKLIVEFHGGKVYASDPEGFEGACFSVAIPLAK